MKNFIKLIIPPIMKPSLIKNTYLNILRDKNYFEYNKELFNRSSFIMRCLLHKNIKTCKYLEIGTCDNLVFDNIPLKNHK